jgi:phosphocarrier protein
VGRAPRGTQIKISDDGELLVSGDGVVKEYYKDPEKTAEVFRDGLSASGDSIMGLLMLAASRGTTIDVETSGPDAEALADALDSLVADKFGEGY